MQDDIWMWDQDWKCTGLRMKKGKAKLKAETDDFSAGEELQKLEEKFQPVMETANLLYKKQPKVPGYPSSSLVYVTLALTRIDDLFTVVTKLFELTVN
jgi:hypothetical protein